MLNLLILSSFGISNAMAETRVNTSRDMYASQQIASARQMPVMIMFAAEECPYCEILESEVLRPMLISGDYGGKVLIRKFMIDHEGKIRDFDGKMIDSSDFPGRYNVFVTPTLVFLGYDGRELAEMIIGVNTLELFAGRVDDALLESLNTLRHTNLTYLEQHQDISPADPSATTTLSRAHVGD
ncbi:MAG TPA: hypothetical protein ENI64_08920 [Gammaproteobacteria bacterium]|nr:hypothetical protein [Gammaproteobacteria bacterium]